MKLSRVARKLIILCGASVSMILLALAVWLVAFEIKKQQKIRVSNQLIANLKTYRQNRGRLPDMDDWKTLKNLGFVLEDLGTQPSYEKLSDNSYKLIFFIGFDGPCLTYRSTKGRWEMEQYTFRH